MTAVETARDLASRFAERATGYDAAGSFPAEDLADLRKTGLLGPMVPVDAAVTHLQGRGPTTLPSVRARPGRADAAVAAARLAVLEAATRVDRSPGEPETNQWVWRAKLLAGDPYGDAAAPRW